MADERTVILIRRGNLAAMPILAKGEMAIALDTNQLFFGNGVANVPISGGGGGGGPSPGNPTASIGLSVINGSASTYMRSDAAPPIDQAIAPTWSALHSFLVSPKTNFGSGTTNNTRLGAGAGNSSSTGDYNVCVGTGCAASATGAFNVFIGAGVNAGASSSGSFNVVLGGFAAFGLTSGAQNFLMGGAAGSSITTQNDNVFIGYAAGQLTTGASNVGVGSNSCFNFTGDDNVAIGVLSGYVFAGATRSSTISLGRFSLPTTSNQIVTGPYISQSMMLTNSSTSIREAYDVKIVAVDNTDATRKYRAVFSVWDIAQREALRIEADGANGLIGFFGGAAVGRQSGTGETAGFSAGVGSAVKDDSIFTGNVGATAYTISDIVKALKHLNLLAP